ncbi:TetR/AcrR family transcriptional regulator [Arthrobacter sp. HY1533]|uniref:TetR/AcrR family transcriptional regulator n=1 Tax=Arthrobacter sp. HY1533 TaxID=2970919 RepID=UPI0022B9FB49|nr:TetR/AcrR family transcriptional regulator [Arthrobacter sp. HY1533]
MDGNPDRRQVRRQETVAEILAAAVRLMAQDGVAGLSLSAVARAVGMRPPSLYVYFPSKMALYDALFARGAAELHDAVRSAAVLAGDDAGPLAGLTAGAHAYVDWCMRNPVTAQLLNWRPVPGFEPSREAFAPSAAMVMDTRAQIDLAVQHGRLAPAAATDDSVLLFTSVIAGVVSQQLANEPQAPPGQGRYTRLLDPALDMWLAHHAP